MKIKLLTKLRNKAFAKSVAKEIEKTALALYKEDLTKSNYERIMKNLSSKMPVTPTAPYEDTSSDTCGTLQKVQEERNYWRSKALELAMDVGKAHLVDVGELSETNCPVQNAIDAIHELESELEDMIAKEYLAGNPYLLTPTHYTQKEGGPFFNWEYDEVNLAELLNRWARISEDSKLITVNGITLHSFCILSPRGEGVPETIFRFDAVNGVTTRFCEIALPDLRSVEGDVGKVPKRLDPFKGKTSQDWDDVIPREEVIDALNLAPWEYSDIQKHRLKKRSTGEEIRIYQAGPKFALFKKIGTGWQPFSDFRYFINLLLEAGDSGYSLRD